MNIRSVILTAVDFTQKQHEATVDSTFETAKRPLQSLKIWKYIFIPNGFIETHSKVCEKEVQ